MKFQFWKKNKNEIGTFKCLNCGEIHNEWPALTYITPSPYFYLSEEEKKGLGKIDSDFCIIKYEDQTDRFIRVVLKLPVINHCEDLEYGVWVSLSEKSFEDYSLNYDSIDREAQYFGWLSNDLPDYDNSESIPRTVYTKKGDLRPEIIPHENFEHQLVKDYYNGITKNEAEKRINNMLNGIKEKNAKD